MHWLPAHARQRMPPTAVDPHAVPSLAAHTLVPSPRPLPSQAPTTAARPPSWWPRTASPPASAWARASSTAAASGRTRAARCACWPPCASAWATASPSACRCGVGQGSAACAARLSVPSCPATDIPTSCSRLARLPPCSLSGPADLHLAAARAVRPRGRAVGAGVPAAPPGLCAAEAAGNRGRCAAA